MFEKARVRGSIVAALGISCAVLILPGLAATRAHAQTLTTLCSFNGSNGQAPRSSLTLVGSTLYGTTYLGGANGDGTVFSIATSGGSPTTLCSLNYSNGEAPYASLTPAGSMLYGTTAGGGANGDGTVFSIATSGGSPTTLCSFNYSNGDYPTSGLTLVGPTLYGTTQYGGANGGGEVFSIATSGGSPTTLCSFNGSNGLGPYAGLTLLGSTLYGTTKLGGNLSLNYGQGGGTVFSIATSGGSPTTLGSFNGSNGEEPDSGLTLVGNTLYGATGYGGNLSLNNGMGYGAVFSIATSGGSPATLCSFGSNGDWPSGLTLVGSTLYGTTAYGGYGSGTVFSIATSGGSPTVLCSFSGSNGEVPDCGLTLVGSTLYGTTYYGGNLSLNGGNGDGTVFAMTLPTSALAWANSGGGSWALPGNWNGNKVPGGSTPDTVAFGNVIGSRTATVTLDGNWAVGSLTFNTSGGGSYTIACSAGDTTSTLMLTGSVTNSGGNHTIASPVVLGSNVTVSTTAGSSLTISGPVSHLRQSRRLPM